MALDSVKLWRLFLISTFWPLILLTSCRQPFIYGIYGQLLRLRYSLKSLWFLLVKVGLVACFACLTVQTATGNSLRLQSLLYWVYCINCSFGHLPSVAPASLFCRPTGDYGRNIPSCITGSTVVLTCCKGDGQSQWKTPIFGPSHCLYYWHIVCSSLASLSLSTYRLLQCVASPGEYV